MRQMNPLRLSLWLLLLAWLADFVDCVDQAQPPAGPSNPSTSFEEYQEVNLELVIAPLLGLVRMRLNWYPASLRLEYVPTAPPRGRQISVAVRDAYADNRAYTTTMRDQGEMTFRLGLPGILRRVSGGNRRIQIWTVFEGSLTFTLNLQPDRQLARGDPVVVGSTDLQLSAVGGAAVPGTGQLIFNGGTAQVEPLIRAPCSVLIQDRDREVPQLPLCQGVTESQPISNFCSQAAADKGKEVAPCFNPFAVDCHEGFGGGGGLIGAGGLIGEGGSGGSGGSGMIGGGIGNGANTGLVGGGGNGSGGSGGGGQNWEVGQSSCTPEERAAADAEERLQREENRILEEANQRIYADMSDEVVASWGSNTGHTMTLAEVMDFGQRHGDVYDLQATITQDLSGASHAADPGSGNLGDPSDQPMDPFEHFGGHWRRRLLDSGRRRYVSPEVYDEFSPLHKATLDELQPKKPSPPPERERYFKYRKNPYVPKPTWV